MCSTSSHLRNSSAPRAAALADFLTSIELAELLGVSLRKLERDRQDGVGITFVKFGRRVLYRRADVEAFLDQRRFTSTAEARRNGGRS